MLASALLQLFRPDFHPTVLDPNSDNTLILLIEAMLGGLPPARVMGGKAPITAKMLHVLKDLEQKRTHAATNMHTASGSEEGRDDEEPKDITQFFLKWESWSYCRAPSYIFQDGIVEIGAEKNPSKKGNFLNPLLETGYKLDGHHDVAEINVTNVPSPAVMFNMHGVDFAQLEPTAFPSTVFDLGVCNGMNATAPFLEAIAAKLEH